MIWNRRRTERPAVFVEATPSLSERVGRAWTGSSGRNVASRLVRLGFAICVAPLQFAFDLAQRAFAPIAEIIGGLRHRRTRDLLWGLPSLLVAVGTAVLSLVVMDRSSEAELQQTYRILTHQAWQADRAEDTAFFADRLMRLDGGQPNTRLTLGLALEKLGRTAEAEQLISGVASGKGGGEPRANKWVAIRLANAPETLKDSSKLAELEHHLSVAEKGLPEDVGVKLVQVRLMLATGRPKLAEAKLAEAAKGDPFLDYDLALLQASLGRTDAARESMVRAVAFSRERLASDPTSRSARVILAQSAYSEGRPSEAIELLKDGVARDPGGPYGPVASQMLVAAYDRLAAAGGDPAKLIAILREALQFDANSTAALDRLVEFAEPRGRSTPGAATGDSHGGDEATAVLESLLAKGEAAPAVHLALGLKAWRRGQADDAEWHLGRAYEMDGSLAAVANNLAWVLAKKPQPELDRALAISNSVVAKWPDVPAYLDTRGEIHLAMGNWSDAVRDLELALPSVKDRARVHRSLSRAYEELGSPDLAERHREEAGRSELKNIFNGVTAAVLRPR